MKESFFLALANALPRLERFDHLRCVLLKLAGLKIKDRVKIWGPVMIRPVGGGKNIEIGSGTFINSEVRFGTPRDKIVIRQNVLVGPRVCFETVNHGMRYIPGKGRGWNSKPIVVEDEVWIGAGAIICPGVTISRGAIVAAGAVVTADVAPFSVVGGVPARLLRALGDA